MPIEVQYIPVDKADHILNLNTIREYRCKPMKSGKIFTNFPNRLHEIVKTRDEIVSKLRKPFISFFPFQLRSKMLTT